MRTLDWLEEMLYQNQMAQQQQEMVNQQLLSAGERVLKTKRKDIINYLQCCSNSSMIEQIDEFETDNARHICMGTKEIKILPKGVVTVPTSEGNINVEYFLCPNCRLLLVNKSSLWMF